MIYSIAMNLQGFHVLIFFQAKPDKSASLNQLLTELVEPSRAEPGCKYYEPFVDLENPDKFTVIEGWETQNQWHAHLKTPHVTRTLAQIEAEQILVQPFTVQQLRALS